MLIKQAAIAIFVFRRPEHTRKMLGHLTKCSGFESSPIYIFCDAAKYIDQKKAVDETRKIVDEMIGARAIVVHAEKNKGLANSIIEGVNAVLESHEKIIVVEDDLVLNLNFLSYMNDALIHFENAPQVMQVSGFKFEVAENSTPQYQKSSFLPFTSSWGWGTWSRAWRQFDPTAQGWKRVFKEPSVKRRFNLDNSYDYSSMLYGQMVGQLDSWAIRWYLSVFERNGLVLYPPKSLVQNNGFDGSGTHGSGAANIASLPENSVSIEGWQFPDNIQVDDLAFTRVKQQLRNQRRRFLDRIGGKQFLYWLRSQMQA
jgi:hypothetical protein